MSAGTSTQPKLSKVPYKMQSTKQKPTNILVTHHGIKLNQQFIFKLPKASKNVSLEVKNSCKIFHFLSEWSLKEVLAAIDGLDPKDYPQLFIFVVDAVNFEVPKELEQNTKKLQEKLLKFGHTRPLVLQLTSVDGNITKIYYKIEDSFLFIDNDQPNNTDPFSTFLKSFYGGQFLNSQAKFYNYVKGLKSCSVLLRFLHTLDLGDGFFGSLLLNFAKKKSNLEFITALDASFINNGRILSYRAQRYISRVFENQKDPESDSVLLTAVQHKNSEIIDYLITYGSHLIQQLPFEHQVKISTVALETNQLDVLCDLLDIADFPFPKNFKADNICHQRLSLITNNRIAFTAAIHSDNCAEIVKFVSNNLSHKLIYNPSNNTALTEAFNMKKFVIFYHFKSYGFRGENCDKILEQLSDADRQQAKQKSELQLNWNVIRSNFIVPKAVMLLLMRSSIHNSRTCKEKQSEYRENVLQWLNDIYILTPDLIKVAASCEELRIIFDFESHSVENMTLTNSSAAGSTYSQNKWIFMGAKLTDNGNMTKQRKQKIKGTLAHELCHYVMHLVYENQTKPYYEVMIAIAKEFENIVKTVNMWIAGGSNIPDDECNGIISKAFRRYSIQNFHQELIVRVVQILVEFDDDLPKTQYLQDKYKILFDFWVNQVIPDLKSFNLKGREAARKMNRLLGLLKNLKSKLYKFNNPKDIKALFDEKLTVVTTNVPTLLLAEILRYLQDTVGHFLDTKNIFVDPEMLKNEEISKDFKKLLKDCPNLNVIVDCSSGIPKDVDDFIGSRTILVLSNKDGKELVNTLKDSKNQEINYDWNDLSIESQEVLIDTEVKFQNRTGLSLLKLFMPENSFKEPESSDAYKNAKNQVLCDSSEVIDDQLLNLLVNSLDISIDVPHEIENIHKDEDFKLHFIERIFLKKEKEDDHSVPTFLQDQLFIEVKGKKIVLISDIAGNGKSWVMKNFTRIFRQDETFNWVTFVDLKQFIDEFKVQKDEPEFAIFMAEKILKPRQEFETKIFQKLYEIGKVLILFDGFDEIAPDCAEFVSKLAQNFQQNGGNQLWISTRDYFEVDLRKMLNTDAVYGLDDLDFDDVVNYIARIWMENDPKFRSDGHESDKNENYENYCEKAAKIVLKFHDNQLSTVGMPLLLKMIAKTFVANRDCSDINVTIIFKNYIEKLIEIWSLERGKISSEASLKCQEFEFGSWKIHHYWAIATLLPEFAIILFPDYDPSEWTDLLIVSCGLINKIGEKVFFIHETYREYLVADYLAKALKKPKFGDGVMEVLTLILVNKKFVVIRMFLNGLVDDLSNLRKLKNFNEIFEHKGFENFFVNVFTENLDKFADFFIESFKSLSYKEKLELLNKTAWKIAENLNDSKSMDKFQKIIFENNLTTQDLKNLIMDQGILQGIIGSSLDFVEFENFLLTVEAKTDREFIRNALTAKIKSFYREGNIFYYLCESRNFSLGKFKKTLNICQKFLNFDEICGLIRNCSKGKESILHLVFRIDFHEINQIWQEIDIFYKNNGASKQFKELIKQKDNWENTVLYELSLHPNVKVHEYLWILLLQSFEDRDELKELFIKNNNENVVYNIMVINSNPAVVKMTLDVLKKNFTNAQFREIIESGTRDGINILVEISYNPKDNEIHKILWSFFKEFCGSDEEFLKMIQEIVVDERNILDICVRSSPIEIFEYMIEELEKLTTRDEIRKMLSHLNKWDENILQTSARHYKSPEQHESVWKVFRKYFEAPEIVNFIKNVDNECDENLLFYAFDNKMLKSLESTWNEIKKILTPDEQVQYLQTENKNGENLLERTRTSKFPDNVTNDKVEWIIKTFKEHNINFTDEQLPSWYLQRNTSKQ